jgi:hypothetical protein
VPIALGIITMPLFAAQPAVMATGSKKSCILTAGIRCDIVKLQIQKRRNAMACKSKGPCGTAKKPAAKTASKTKKK